MEDVVIKFTMEQFLQTTEPYDYLVSIDNPMERDRETAAYKKFALKNCDISAVTFKNAMKEAYAKNRAEKNDNSPREAQFTEFTGQKFPLRCPGYYCNDSGVWKESIYGPTRVLMHPIMPVARIVDYETHEHKTAVAFRVGNQWNTQIVSRDVLSTRVAFTKQMSLADAFVTSENCAGVISFLADVESANIDKLPVMHSASRLGWHGNKFLPFESDLIFDGDIKFKAAFDSIAECGSKKAWFDFALKVRSNNWIIERCMLAASFASVLIEPLKALPFFVHCWADGSGTGKTVSMMLGGSVWGNPRIGKFCQGLNITNVGVEMMAGFLGSLPLCMDELCTKDKRDKSKEIEAMVYNYCLNTGRIRGSRNGGIQRIQSWCNCALTTGEMPIVSDDSRAGAANRVIEVECTDEKLFGGNAKPVSAFLSENYGFAGKMFVELIQKDGAIAEIKNYVKEYEEELKKTGATDKQYNSMAIILAADKFATEHMFKDGRNLTCDDVSRFLKKESDVDTNRKAYEALMGRIIANNKRFEPRDDRTSGDLLGCFEKDKEGNVYACIIRSEFGKLLYNAESDTQYNVASFLKWAKRMKVITLSSKGEPTIVKRIYDRINVTTRCVCIRMNAFDVPENEPAKIDPQTGFVQVDLPDEERPW